MASIPQGASSQHNTADGANYTVPLVIITILFFMWGSITSLNDVLIPHLKGIYNLSYAQAALVQVWFFGAYFLVSIPAGLYVRSFGYQKGAVTGLVIAAAGCGLFYPAASSGYLFFLFAFFIMAAGITVLQVSANPYVAVLGAPKTASSRLTLTQAFNSLGTWFAPTFIGSLILGGATFLSADQIAQLAPDALANYRMNEAASVQLPYLALAAALLILAVVFATVKLPKVTYEAEPKGFKRAVMSNVEALKLHPHLALGVLGIFLYVGAEVSIGTYLVNFFGLPEVVGMKESDATVYLGLYWLCAMIGRFIGFAVMRFARPGTVLMICALGCITMVLTAIALNGPVAMWAIISVGLFNSIMFPTIFTMALHNLGKYTSQGSGLLCMAIVGGAVVPYLQGMLADSIGLQLSFLLPAACYLYISFYGKKYAKLYEDPKAAPSLPGV
jgi:MFS transporter, FHS family, L-fucose permease